MATRTHLRVPKQNFLVRGLGAGKRWVRRCKAGGGELTGADDHTVAWTVAERAGGPAPQACDLGRRRRVDKVSIRRAEICTDSARKAASAG